MGDAGGQQIYAAWDLGFSEPLDLTVEALIDDWEGFRILLRNHKTGRMIRIAFDTHAASQNRDETDVVGELSRSGITKPDISIASPTPSLSLNSLKIRHAHISPRS
jgi:hypothetical protein